MFFVAIPSFLSHIHFNLSPATGRDPWPNSPFWATTAGRVQCASTEAWPTRHQGSALCRSTQSGRSMPLVQLISELFSMVSIKDIFYCMHVWNYGSLISKMAEHTSDPLLPQIPWKSVLYPASTAHGAETSLPQPQHLLEERATGKELLEDPHYGPIFPREVAQEPW